MKNHVMPSLVMVLAFLGCQQASQADAIKHQGASAQETTMADASSSLNPPPPPMARGKRAAPADVPAVKLGKISYEVVHWGRMRDLPQNGGYLAAKDAAGKELWIEQIYQTKPDPQLEGDVQDVFITSLKVARDGKTLEMQDERGRTWRFDPLKRKVLP